MQTAAMWADVGIEELLDSAGAIAILDGLLNETVGEFARLSLPGGDDIRREVLRERIVAIGKAQDALMSRKGAR